MRNAVRRRARAAQADVVLVMLFLAGLCAPATTRAQAALDSVADSTPISVLPAQAFAPLIVYGDTIAYFARSVAGVPPERRTVIARQRIQALRHGQLLQSAHAEPLDRGHMVLVGETYVFMFMDGDVPAGRAAPGASAAEQAALRLGDVLHRRALALAPGRRLAGLAWTVGATLLLVLLILVLRWLRRTLLRWIDARAHTQGNRLQLGDVDVFSHFTWLITWVARAAVQLSSAVLVVFWAVFVMNQFPETMELGATASGALLGTLRTFQDRFVSAVPGIIAVGLIVFFSRFLMRLSGDLFAGAERGTIRLPGVHPETAHATRRLVSAAIWLFAVVVAYPLLPGSGSDAFKGVSVFLGLMVTLGSSGVMGHMMSGLVIVYSRALQPGDIVRVNEIEGKVTEVGALSVKVTTSLKEEFTIPNAVIVGTTVKNYSRLDRELGPSLIVAVTIGYDAPWRVVHELLLAAAARTEGVRKEPAPSVFQAELSDFFVVYQLTVRAEHGRDRYRVRSELNQNIQDAFNERGVQIMSPHYEGQPEGRVWVPKRNWAVAPEDAGR